MVRARSEKADLENRTFLDGAIYLYRRKSSKRGLWDVRLKIAGHRGYVTRTTGMANEHEAYKVAHELYLDCLARQRMGRALDSKRIAVGLDDFVAEHEPLPMTDDFKTVLAMARMLKGCVGKDRFDDIDTAYIRRMLDYVAANGRKGTASQNTYRRNVTRIKTMIKWWVANSYMLAMPAMPVFQAEKNRRPHFSDADWRKVIAAIPEFARAEGVATKRDRLMLVNWLMVMYHTGLRMGEARGLRWEDIRPIADIAATTRVNVALTVSGKTGRRTVVASSGEVRRHLSAVVEIRRSDLQNPASDIYCHNDVPASSLVFCHPNGKPIGSFKKSFLALLQLAGVTHSPDGRARTPYSLRHTYATERLNAGVQEYHLAQNMGTSVAMLEQHYGHTSTVRNVGELTKPARVRGVREQDTADFAWLAA
jgi:integrase